MTNHIGDHRATLLAAAELVDSIAAQAARESELYATAFRIGYRHGYPVGHAHGYDLAQAEAAAEWTAHAAHMRRLRETGKTDRPLADEARVSAAVAAAERLVRAMAWRHWDAFTARQARAHPHRKHRQGRSA